VDRVVRFNGANFKHRSGPAGPSKRSLRAAIPHLKANPNGGSIVLTSSSVAFKAQQHTSHYTAAKHGIVGLMKTLAIDLAPHMIT
jgi:(+)-trans-carveol dehydrogenase